MIGIAGEHLGREEFLAGFWKGELFFDLGKKSWFPAVHGGKKKTSTAHGIWSLLTGGVVSRAVKRTKEKGVEGNLKGEGFTLGGVWVVHPAKGVIFEYREKHWGDSVLESGLTELMQAINQLVAPSGQPLSMSMMQPTPTSTTAMQEPGPGSSCVRGGGGGVAGGCG